MTQYVDSSALIKRYVNEAGAEDARLLLYADTDWVTANHTYIEVYRALHARLSEDDVETSVEILGDDWSRTAVVLLDEELCRRAALLAVATGSRTLDALHLAAADRSGGRSLPFLTFDIRQAQAARSLGWTVLGA